MVIFSVSFVKKRTILRSDSVLSLYLSRFYYPLSYYSYYLENLCSDHYFFAFLVSALNFSMPISVNTCFIELLIIEYGIVAISDPTNAALITSFTVLILAFFLYL